MTAYPSPNHGPRPDGAVVDMLVLHYTGMADADAALRRMTDPAAEVSAHYMIDEDGAVLQLVDEARRAWHAGVARWRGHDDINSRSIGIELVNPGHEFGYRAFADPQMVALTAVAADIVARHPIPPRNVVGHSDIAPARKCDPGELFDWRGLADAGIGLWPGEADGETESVFAMLARYGYDTGDAGAALTAFQRHFRPGRIDGIVDAGCARLLTGLLAAID
jgi:N-acetylmuramoyl-L-alanine amidase